MKTLSLVLAALAALGALGCAGDEPSSPRGPEEPEEPQEPGPEPVVWGACPEFFQTECATVEVPLRHDDPEGATVPVLIARRPSGAPGAAQLWLLQGGPGGPGADFYELVDFMAEYLPGFDIYTLDHRGVGQSERLGCDAEEDPASPNGTAFTPAEWASCAQHLEETKGDRLDAFTTSNAARDLAYLIERTREPDQKTFVWGASYGTTWAMRYLQLFPEQAAGVVLDSVVSPGVQFLSQFDAQFDSVGMKLADVCAADAACSARLGADPWAFISALYEKVDAGHCSQYGITRPLMRNIFAALLMGWDSRRLIMPVAYRLDRCEVADAEALGHMVDLFWGGPAAPSRGFSAALQVHIAFSEMWEDPAPTAAEMQARADAALASSDFGPYTAPAYEPWPRYAPDEHANGWPTTSIPILMLNGTMDPQTPIETAEVAAERLQGPGQTFVTVPQAVHGVIGTPAATPGAMPCGAAITFSFLKDPTAPPDTSCLSDLKQLDFNFPAEEAEVVFGIADAWDNPPPPMGKAQPPAAGAAAPRIDESVIERIRARRRPIQW